MTPRIVSVRSPISESDARPKAKRLLLTTKEAAQILSVAPRTVRLWAESLVLPAFKVGNHWRFRPGDVSGFIISSCSLRQLKTLKL
jgi:excisionase family DNA binding protein